MTVQRLILRGALWLSAFWDLITTFLGTLLLLGSNGFVQIGISLVGTLIVGALNFSTKSIWTPPATTTADPAAFFLLRLIWVLTLLFDLFTSLTCNATYVAYQNINIGNAPIQFIDILAQLNDSQVFVVVFVTVLATASPVVLSYLSTQDIDFWGR